MKGKMIIWLLFLVFCVPPLINLIITTPSSLGFIAIDKQDAWINFYGAIIGGCLTLLGVIWTISYTESTRKDDEEKHRIEQIKEFERRDLEIKKNLSAQYKPILTVSCHPDFIIEGVKFGMSTYKNMFVQNVIVLSDNIHLNKTDKRLSILSMDIPYRL